MEQESVGKTSIAMKEEKLWNMNETQQSITLDAE